MVCFWNIWITAIEILNSVSGREKFSACLRQCYALWLCFMTFYIMLQPSLSTILGLYEAGCILAAAALPAGARGPQTPSEERQ
jgi:hypothetical protein